ncbi:Sensor histidine kinase YehU [Mucilaginibacter xinganensis]|uniref:Sensor histidine kinase YehU n=2 Tax=Mucilaginibacter xinganensis TaxID=1234841 RepID=A0A223NW82_9SPHI|nr:Sensor histidine kinase YehU [Mucilaginibacter xinganensis]
MMNSPRLLALKTDGLVAHYWHFNLAELIFQVTFNFGFCYLLFYLNLTTSSILFIYRNNQRKLLAYFLNFLLLLFCCIVGGIVQRHSFIHTQLRNIYWLGYISRYFLTTILAAILIKIILLLRIAQKKEKENEQLKTVYLEAELELLKEQLNPHFLFNSLSTLSGVVREDPVKAQYFINHLSKIFRYSLDQSGNQMATIEEELNMIRSYEQLLKMRFEEAFVLTIAIDTEYLNFKVPHLSLQPLLENAAKHNSASKKKPLRVEIFIADYQLVVSNNLQAIPRPENSTGIGLSNLSSRVRILMHDEIVINKTTDSFSVKLPIQR